MPTGAFIGYPAQLKRGDSGSPEVFTKIAEVLKVTPPGVTNEQIEVTNMDSPSGFKEFILGMGDPGEVSFGVNFQPDQATHDATTGLWADAVAKTVRNWKLVFADSTASTVSFSAMVTALKINEVAPNSAVTADLTLKVTGSPVWS